MVSISNNVSRTALDSLNSKVSALHVGYQPVKSQDNGEIYNQLLMQMSQLLSPARTKVKRQTPLVNAGYAFRIAAVTETLRRFVRESEKVSDDNVLDVPTINIVLVGSGFDVLGLWALSLHPGIKVYEIDCYTNAKLKMEALLKMNATRKFLVSDEVSKDEHEEHTEKGVLLRGTIDHTLESGNNPSSMNYSLIAADLRDLSFLEDILKDASLDTSFPTCVCSELVLAYIEEISLTHILNFYALKLCHGRNSCFLAYEPIYPSLQSSLRTSHVTVNQGYAETYFNQFDAKIHRGNAKSEQTTSNFRPLGKTIRSVENMLRMSGFGGPISCSPMEFAMKQISYQTASPEPFDEHAALRLHFQCYAIITAFSSDTSLSTFKKISPWASVRSATRGIGFSLKKNILIDGVRIAITAIKTQLHEEGVRTLYKETYVGMFDDFPSVKKMVKSALKTDLSSINNTPNYELEQYGDSAIWNRYSGADGTFWVALEETSGDVIGCVGMKPIIGAVDKKILDERECFELHRLAVSENFRGKGIGRQLVQVVEENILARSNEESFSIIAITPKVLAGANAMYSSLGFKVLKEEKFGKMEMRTFVKYATN